MSLDNTYLSASAGTGAAVLMHVESARSIGATTINVDAVTNVPAKFIATSGNLLATGFIDPATQTDFYGHLNVTQLVIDGFCPGFSDTGTPEGYVVIIKPTTSWADQVAATLKYMTATSGQPAAGWNILGYTPTYNGNNGNKEYLLQVTGQNLTNILSNGTKLSCQPVTTPLAQCGSFVSSSSQYATLASPTGISFTTTFTVMGWVNLSSYVQGSVGGRYNGTNGFSLQFTAAGQLVLNVNTTTYQVSYQSVPLNQWTHVAGTFSSGTFNLYINGVLVPSYLTGSATSVTQAGPLQIGANNSITLFNGDMSQVAIYSTALTQATIQSYMSKTLTGSETSCVGLWLMNGNFNDSSTNANNLTATGGAIATYAANPFNTTEYGIITNVAYSGGNTNITVFTGKSNNIPNGTLQNFFYSNARAPYGFPAQRNNWTIEFKEYGAIYTQSTPTGGVVYNIGKPALSIPTGNWLVTFQAGAQSSTGSAVYQYATVGLSTANNSFSDNYMIVVGAASTSSDAGGTAISRPLGLTLAAQTFYYLNFSSSVSPNNLYNLTDRTPCVIVAECAYI